MGLEKYLPALRCLLAIREIDPDHPACHELSGRFKLALDRLEQPLPDKVKEVIDSCYLSKLDSKKSLEDCNEEYLASHRNDARHVQSVVRLRNVLDPGSEKTKTMGADNLLEMLKLDSAELTDASDGLQLLRELGVGAEVKEKYCAEARDRWPEATVFQQS